MIQHGFRNTTIDHCIFLKKFSDTNFIILSLYVDDMLIVGHNLSRIDRLKKEFSKFFVMKDLGLARQILDMYISHDREVKKLWLSQERYTEKVF